jgi:hypothetical protein
MSKEIHFYLLASVIGLVQGGILYGGRKGFVDLMLSKEQTFENISVWMGHSTLDRTWRSYKQRRKFHLR